MLSVKQDDIKYHFLSLWYDSTWDWTPISRSIGEYSTYLTNEEGEKRDKYVDLARELGKQWNMKVTVLPTVTGKLRTIPNDWWRDWTT